MAATVIPDVPEYSGDVPLIGQGEVEFSQNAQDNLVYQKTLAPNINATVAQMNVFSSELNDALTRTVIANDSELFTLPPNAPIQFNGNTVRPNTLVGTLINNEGIAGKCGAIMHEAATGGVWFYIPNANAPLLNGVVIDLTGENEANKVFGGYTERVTSAIEAIDASMYNVCVALALTGAKTIAFVNVPTQMYTCQVTFSDAGSLVITLPSGIETPGGVAPTYTTGGKDKLIFQTSDQGSTWDLSVINDIKAILPPAPPLLWSTLVRYVESNTTSFSQSSVAVNDELVFYGVNQTGGSMITRDDGATFTQAPALTSRKVTSSIGHGSRLMTIQSSPDRRCLLSLDGFSTIDQSYAIAPSSAHSVTASPDGDLIALLYNSDICGYSNANLPSYAESLLYEEIGTTSVSAIAANSTDIYMIVKRSADSARMLVKTSLSEFRSGTATFIEVVAAELMTTVFAIDDSIYTTKNNNIYKLSEDELSLDLVASNIYVSTESKCATSNGKYAVVIGGNNAVLFDGLTVTALPDSLNNGGAFGVNSVGTNGNTWASLSQYGFASISIPE